MFQAVSLFKCLVDIIKVVLSKVAVKLNVGVEIIMVKALRQVEPLFKFQLEEVTVVP